MPEALFEIRDLAVRFATDAGTIEPAAGVSFAIAEGEVLGLVGESGSGKSVTARAAIRLLRPENAVKRGARLYRGRDLGALDDEALRKLRAREIAMIVQDPAGALNPTMTVGAQLIRVARLHGATHSDAAATALDMLRRLRIAAPERRMAAYPHQLSGGMRQRALMALALMCGPKLLIADEPTTALDVTVEAEILALLDGLRRETGMAMLLISHNLSVIGRICDRIAVMYAGRVVEEGTAAAVLADPKHPYTRALLASVPAGAKADTPLRAIPGEPPDLARLDQGCAFRPRCPDARAECASAQTLRALPAARASACWRSA
jgi:oligopeptide/dipeptide ABC transporter ATP-binding protein